MWSLLRLHTVGRMHSHVSLPSVLDQYRSSTYRYRRTNMQSVSVRVVPNGKAPEPELPDGLADPCIHHEVTLHGREWLWDGTNVLLVRHPSFKLISEQLSQLNLMYEAEIFRPLQANELHQLKVYSDKWPDRWMRHPDGRIFCAGTKYPVAYPGGVDHEFIWATWYDNAQSAWDCGCFATDSMLRPHDEFACIALTESASVEVAFPWPKIPALRLPHLSVRGRASFKGR